MKELVEALRRKQEERGENQAEFARFLGISQGALSRIYNDNRGVGGRVLAKILARYPGFASFFASEYANQN